MINVKVISKTRLTSSVTKFVLAHPNEMALPSWTPGAHIEIELPNGMLRQYSLCGTPSAKEYEIAVLNELDGRGGSRYLHQQVQPGDVLPVSEPKNHFELHPSSCSCLFFAAGIGVTPILTMAEACQLSGRDFDFFMCAKTIKDTPYIGRISELQNAVVHSSQSSGARLDIREVLSSKDRNSEVYVCGPQAFIDDVLTFAQQLGWSTHNLHREYFGLQSSADKTDSATFSIEIKSTGDVFEVTPEQTVLEVLEENDIFVPVACEEGVCGTCVTNIVEGVPEHLDVFLTDEEKAAGQCFTPCCSRAQSSKLVLDL